ncbi:PepSY domain-containing protein [Thalassospiraceae bacterium LMO-SO8]|nr:PepSY domain-containing protein [Alphaproteobacteria bacterium LMO-S08]WND77052.1 PepSY domain-containing protein [Thalassospiraceae bacterium LMO-SO8]
MYGSCKNGYFRRMRRFTILVLTALLSAASVPALADGGGEHRDGYKRDDDHDRARRALERGEILPLTDILKRANKEYPGQLIEAELDDDHGGMVYELVIISAEGRVYKLYYDARTGELLKVKGRGRHE